MNAAASQDIYVGDHNTSLLTVIIIIIIMSCVCSTKTTRYIYGYERNFVHEYLYKCVCVKKLCCRFVVHLSVASLHFNHNCNQHEPFWLNFMYACILPFERNDLLNVLCSSIFNRSNLLSDKRFIQKAGPIF